MSIQRWRQFDFSLGVQEATTWLLKKPNELARGVNLRFTEEVGGFQRRDGFEPAGSTFASGLPAQGGHVAKFSTGSKRFVAVNNAGGTATIIRTQNSGTGAWTDLSTISYPVNSVIFFLDYLDEVYISGFDPATGDPVRPYNVDKTLNVSSTRNLLNCPWGYFFAEYLGLLYVANVMVATERFADRAYKSSPPLGAVTFVQGVQSGTLTSLRFDSVRYIKPGSTITIYTAGTDTVLHNLTVTAVNKLTNIVSFASTVIAVGDNDEVWLTGTKGRLNIFWNVDYPTPQSTGEFLAVKPGTDSSNIITAIAKSANRLFLFTRNSGTRWDGQNLVVFNNNVGCISQRSIANLDDDWLIYMDAKGNIRARNENTGQAEQISRGVRNRYLRKLTQTQMKASSGGVVDNVYKIYLGTIENQYIRLCYDFDANTWSPERLGYPALIQATDDYTGILKPYFFSNNGKLYIDETGNKDDDLNIAFEAGTGRDMFGSEQMKKFYGILLFCRNCNGLKLEASVDGGKMLTVGRIEGEVCWMKFNENGDNVLPEGTSIDWQVMGSGEGDPPKVEGAVVYYDPREDVPNERRP